MTVISLTAKCSDMFAASLMRDGQEFGEYDGYVPNWMPGEHYGDYVILQINIENGQIINWLKPTDALCPCAVPSTRG
jgi:hypothetical protein